MSAQVSRPSARIAERSQTAIFSKLVGACMAPVPLAVHSGASCADVVARMREENASSVTVVDGAGRPLGLITEQDVTRRIAFRAPPETPVDAVMTTPLQTIEEEEYLYRAIALMRRSGIRHMPVVDAEGTLTGMLSQHDAMARAADRQMGRIDRLTQEGSLNGLRGIKEAQIDLAEDMFADGLPAPEIQALLSHINNGIYRKILRSVLRAMLAEGWGPAPVPFTTIVMGSGGRGENFLLPDQDNGFIIADYPDEEHGRIDAFFMEVAQRLTRDLDAVGFPLCRGYCMAVNPLWRKTLPQWIEQVSLWGRKKNFVAIRLADIFFDFLAVSGPHELADELREAVLRMIGRNHFFLQAMWQEIKDHNVALGMFGQLVTEGGKKKVKSKGLVNLKLQGILPLVEAIRLMALRHGVAETSTLKRMAALHEGGVLDAGEHEDLATSFTTLTGLLMREQIHQFRAGEKVGPLVATKALSKGRRRDLVDALGTVDALRKRVRTDITGEIF